MLRKLRSRLTYANVVASLALFVALGTGGAYAASTIGSSDIIDGEVKSIDVGQNEIKSADVKDESLTTFDVSTFLGADVVDGTLTGDDIRDASLKDEDVGQAAYFNFSVEIGVIPADRCRYYLLQGFNAAADHLLLTPSYSDSLTSLSYGIEYTFNSGFAEIKACNPTPVDQDDFSTHFNLLVFDAQ